MQNVCLNTAITGRVKLFGALSDAFTSIDGNCDELTDMGHPSGYIGEGRRREE